MLQDGLILGKVFSVTKLLRFLAKSLGAAPGKVRLNLLMGYSGTLVVQGLLHLGAEPGVVFGGVCGECEGERTFIRSSGEKNANGV